MPFTLELGGRGTDPIVELHCPREGWSNVDDMIPIPTNVCGHPYTLHTGPTSRVRDPVADLQLPLPLADFT
jgi:hypothetical protein